nr:hypothetical protein [uncultured Albidiferax sp.]
MHLKLRGNRAMLYRSSWIPKGTSGNTHGYSIQQFVGSLPVDSPKLPADLADVLSVEEVSLLEARVFQPARLAADKAKRFAEQHEADPVWRLDEATRLTLEAASRSQQGAVPNAKVAAVQSALANVRTIVQMQTPPITSVQLPELSKVDPLKELLAAIQAARRAVLDGRYGTAPSEGVRSTYAYKMWADIFEAVGGSGGSSLMNALQTKGFAKTRGK